jgi:TonB family protein
LLFAFIAAAPAPGAAMDCPPDVPLQIVPPADAQAPIMPFGAPVPPAKAVISVVVGQDGRITKENIFGSSGYSALDLAAYTMIEKSRFTPKTVNCKPVTAFQLIVVDFSQTPPSVTAVGFPTP